MPWQICQREVSIPSEVRGISDLKSILSLKSFNSNGAEGGRRGKEKKMLMHNNDSNLILDHNNEHYSMVECSTCNPLGKIVVPGYWEIKGFLLRWVNVYAPCFDVMRGIQAISLKRQTLRTVCPLWPPRILFLLGLENVFPPRDYAWGCEFLKDQVNFASIYIFYIFAFPFYSFLSF